MTHFEKLSALLADGNWHSTEERGQQVGHRFSTTLPIAIQNTGTELKRDVGAIAPVVAVDTSMSIVWCNHQSLEIQAFQPCSERG